jgi:hypothetical protein
MRNIKISLILFSNFGSLDNGYNYKMAEPAISSSQSNGFPFQKTFSAYVQTTKTFQPFVSPTAAINISPNLVKST